MKCVLMSIQAEHSYNIFSGLKDDEVRKRPPKLVPPFKVYVYQSRGSTKGKPVVFSKGKIHDLPHGVVVGEFICDRIVTVRSKRAAMRKHPRLRTCITMDQLLQYMGKNDEVSFLHIKERDVYDHPLPLAAFRACTPKIAWDNGTPEISYELTRPPQSWCYVEELRGHTPSVSGADSSLREGAEAAAPQGERIATPVCALGHLPQRGRF